MFINASHSISIFHIKAPPLFIVKKGIKITPTCKSGVTGAII
nr:MAG TPA: hypothetical protein [Caudoviricetes sp.]